MNTKKLFILELVVREIRPKISRTLAIDASASLSTLHRAIQVLFGWYDYHLHEFVVGDETYAADDGDGLFEPPPKSTRKRLSSLLTEKGDSLLYLYDFGDDWQVDIRLESVIEVAKSTPKVSCFAANRSGPLEDSGGPWGYMEKLDILCEPEHEDYELIREWVPEGFDSEFVDIEEINEQLLRL